MPDIKGREMILKKCMHAANYCEKVSFDDMARLTASFSGADLENLLNEAAIFAARRNRRTIRLARVSGCGLTAL
ncbi:MAG: hypothetical protein R3E31_14310 [Chloroflexota bacterium]